MVRVQSQVFHWVLWTVFFCTEGFAVRAQTTSTIQFVNRLGGAGRCVAVKDHYAYLDHGRRLGIYDIADPSRPVKTGEITLERNGYPRHGFKSMTIDGSRAYILLEAPNEQNSPICDLYDLTNPAAPAFVRNLNSVYFRLFSQASNLYWDRLDAAGDDLYCSNKNGLWILNQSNPARTDVLGGYTPEGTVRCDMAATSRTAFLLRNGSIFETVDVSTPTLPKCMARLDLAITSTSATRMHLAGGLALVMDEQRLHVIDVSAPTSPTLLSTLPLPYSAERSGTARWDFTTSGTKAFLFGDFSLNAIDFSDPRAPRLMPEYPFPVAGLDLQGGLAVCREGGLLVMRDLASPSAAVPLGRAGLDLLGVRQIEAADGTLYCIDDAGLKVLTPAGLSNGELTAKLEGASGPMTLGGSRLYLNGPDFRILDVADPRAPRLVGRTAIPGAFSNRGSLDGTRFYTQTGAKRLTVMDVSDPTSPTVVGQADFPSSFFDYLVRDQIACLLIYGGEEIYDMHNPAQPVLIGRHIDGTNSNPNHDRSQMALNGRYLYVPLVGTVHDGTVEVFDIDALMLSAGKAAVPDKSGHVAARPSQGAYMNDTYFLRVFGNLNVSLVTFNWGATDTAFNLWNVQNPASPRFVASYTTCHLLKDVAVESGLFYLAEGDDGLLILRYTGPAPSAVGGPWSGYP